MREIPCSAGSTSTAPCSRIEAADAALIAPLLPWLGELSVPPPAPGAVDFRATIARETPQAVPGDARLLYEGPLPEGTPMPAQHGPRLALAGRAAGPALPAVLDERAAGAHAGGARCRGPDRRQLGDFPPRCGADGFAADHDPCGGAAAAAARRRDRPARSERCWKDHDGAGAGLPRASPTWPTMPPF